MNSFARVAISGVEIPDNWALRREMPLAPEKRSQAYIDSFDQRSLIYDAFLKDGTLRLICPRLYNLWPLLRGGFTLAGQRVRPRRRKTLRFEELSLFDVRGPAAAQDLRLTLPEGTLSIPVHEDAAARFRGKRAAFTMFKEVPPEWIFDWARWHKRIHGTQSVLLIQNGADQAVTETILAGLAQDVGLDGAVILHAPFPYGGKAGGKLVRPAKFLQVGMMNLARQRFLSEARSVLNADIDELAAPLPGSSIHAAAEASAFGIVHFEGTWIYPSEPVTGPLRHWMQDATSPDGACRNPKWCLTPTGLANRFDWAVHRSGGPLHPLTRRSFTYWHFHATTTGWKRNAKRNPGNATPNPEIRNALTQVFGG